MLKRVFDFLVALVLLLILSPVFLLVAILIGCTLGRPVIFRQRRSGRFGKPFTLFKFRSMTDARGADGTLLPDAERLPPVGQFIRSTSLDELPQLVNVIRGEMSLVGPRPLPPAYIERYTPQQARRLEVCPGITGWTAVNGRSLNDWETRFDLDVYYVEHQSFSLDIYILWRTFLTVISRQGISSPGEATQKEFLGILASSPEKPTHKGDA